MQKIFCIGFHKTGTTSIGRALEILGYKVTGPNLVDDEEISVNALPFALNTVPYYDAFQDNPWPLLYKELDQNFENSIFILTIRDEKSWIKSALGQFSGSETPMRRWIYGVGDPTGNEQIFIDRYNKHNAEVIEYFNGRELLVLNFFEGDGWYKLCNFLGKQIPDVDFPHLNKAEDKHARLCDSTTCN